MTSRRKPDDRHGAARVHHLVGGAAAAWPLAARAQQGDRMRRVGVLMAYAESDPEGQAQVAAFREELQKLGWAEGRNIRIDSRWATPGDAESRDEPGTSKEEQDALMDETLAIYDRVLEQLPVLIRRMRMRVVDE
jgi:hypothetical protein